jgi:hypothetical protein
VSEQSLVRQAFRLQSLLMFFSLVGPGIITANADNDVGGILTYSQAGAQFGYTLLEAVRDVASGRMPRGTDPGSHDFRGADNFIPPRVDWEKPLRADLKTLY